MEMFPLTWLLVFFRVSSNFLIQPQVTKNEFAHSELALPFINQSINFVSIISAYTLPGLQNQEVSKQLKAC